mmetsp:Transcript_15954/g.13510  ORF Transcript_15954/g.13510 Transcript_15954/m.13510 type:complete len:119 (-) Transcript_15954:251-607(-)
MSEGTCYNFLVNNYQESSRVTALDSSTYKFEYWQNAYCLGSPEISELELSFDECFDMVSGLEYKIDGISTIAVSGNYPLAYQLFDSSICSLEDAITPIIAIRYDNTECFLEGNTYISY